MKKAEIIKKLVSNSVEVSEEMTVKELEEIAKEKGIELVEDKSISVERHGHIKEIPEELLDHFIEAGWKVKE